MLKQERGTRGAPRLMRNLELPTSMPGNQELGIVTVNPTDTRGVVHMRRVVSAAVATLFLSFTTPMAASASSDLRSTAHTASAKAHARKRAATKRRLHKRGSSHHRAPKRAHNSPRARTNPASVRSL